MEWPFKHMSIGETRILFDVPIGRAQAYVHVFARSRGWRFKTQQVVDNGRIGLAVKRLKDPEPTSA